VVPGVSEDHIPFIFKGNESTKSVLHRHEGTTVLANLGNYLPINMELHPKILESVQTVVCRISSIRFRENLFGVSQVTWLQTDGTDEVLGIGGLQRSECANEEGREKH
jgi:hypothetical protein